MPDDAPLLLGSITDAGPDAAGRVVVCGSHGGLYPGWMAARSGLRAVVLNDAGVGLDDAGVAGIMALEAAGIAAAAADCMSCRIGDAEDMWARGRISRANARAAALGVAAGQPVPEAVGRLARAERGSGAYPRIAEGRRSFRLPSSGLEIVLLDSASLVRPEDAGRIVVTGSHGGLIGGDAARALKADAAFAVFNDAGGGADGAGFTRLPALDSRRVPAATVAHATARIGDAASTAATGVISRVNDCARRAGAEIGMPLGDWGWLRSSVMPARIVSRNDVSRP